MQMPHLGDVIYVYPASSNVEEIPATGRFLKLGEWTSVTVSHHIAARILDGAVFWAANDPTSTPAPSAAARKPEVK